MHTGNINERLAIPARLAIVATCADGTAWSFTRLRAETGLADGNLHVQTGKLVTAGYLAAAKERQGGRMVTTFRLTDNGLRSFREFLHTLAAALGEKDLRFSGPRPASSSGKEGSHGAKDDSQVW